MTNPNDTAYPAAGVRNYEESNQVGGLTKLEMFSAMAMQAFISNPFVMESFAKQKTSSKDVCEMIAESSLEQAKALIEALNKEGK